jgi:hypothetical protein
VVVSEAVKNDLGDGADVEDLGLVPIRGRADIRAFALVGLTGGSG